MAVFRLYRKFYTINYNSGNETYTLLNPLSLSASTYVSNTLVEYNLTVVQESTGIYYVDLTPSNYNNQNAYELRWTVKYTSSSPYKILQTLFRYEPTTNQINVFGAVDYEIQEYGEFIIDTVNDNNVDYEIAEQNEIVSEIPNNENTFIDYEITDQNEIIIEVLNNQ